jgi:hypothetical protein
MEIDDPFRVPGQDSQPSAEPDQPQGVADSAPSILPITTTPIQPQPEEELYLTKTPELFQRVDARGKVYVCKKTDDGVIVRVREAGTIKDVLTQELRKAAIMKPSEITEALQSEPDSMTAFERAALTLASSAAAGDREAINTLLDRIIGRPKQTSESVSVSFSIDDILTGKATMTNPPNFPDIEVNPDE